MYLDVCEPLFQWKQADCLVWLAQGRLKAPGALAEPCLLTHSVSSSLAQGRPLSYKTFLIWVLISIYQGKDGQNHRLSCALALPEGHISCAVSVEHEEKQLESWDSSQERSIGPPEAPSASPEDAVVGLRVTHVTWCCQLNWGKIRESASHSVVSHSLWPHGL